MPFYGVFVTFQCLDFLNLFRQYWKKDEPNIGPDCAQVSSVTSPEISEPIWGRWYGTTLP